MPCVTKEGQRRLDSYREWEKTGAVTCRMCKNVWKFHTVGQYRKRSMVHTCYDYDDVMRNMSERKSK